MSELELRLLPKHHPPREELELEALEERRPGAAWRERFEAMRPTYRTWYLQEATPAGPATRPAGARSPGTIGGGSLGPEAAHVGAPPHAPVGP